MRVRTTEPESPKKKSAKDETNPFMGLSVEARHKLALTMIARFWADAAQAQDDIGKTVFQACHDQNATSALADGAEANEVYQRIATSVETMKIGLSSERLSVWARVAAADQANENSDHWTRLQPGFKEVLILLPTTDLMKEGAKHCFDAHCTIETLTTWVNEKRKEHGKAPTPRGVQLPSTLNALDHLAKAALPEGLDRIVKAFDKLTEHEQQKVLERLDAAGAAVQKLRRKLGR